MVDRRVNWFSNNLSSVVGNGRVAIFRCNSWHKGGWVSDRFKLLFRSTMDKHILVARF